MSKKSDRESEGLFPGGRIPVLLPLPFDGAFDYACADPAPPPGTFVQVPLGHQQRISVIWDEESLYARAGEPVAAHKLKPVEKIFDLRPMTEEHRKLIDWVAAYTVSPPGPVLRMSLSAHGAFSPPPTRTVYQATGILPERMTKARQRVLETAGGVPPMPAAELARQAGVSDGVVRGLAKSGALNPIEQTADPPYPSPLADRMGPHLSPDQRRAVASLEQGCRAGGFQPMLLEGVTGAGKTEVYFELIATTLRDREAQILVLLPEIALTAQWLGRFEARFGACPVEWHSDLGQAERRRAWRAVNSGHARVVVGARSALFLPFQKLKLIVVDEEHDPVFKQEDGVRYNARDMAVVRASLAEIPIVLSSATPSMESLVNAKSGRYRHVCLEERHGVAELPKIAAIDLRRDPPEPGKWLAPPLVEAMERTFAAGEQALLFLNRRGYAPLTLCRSCGTRLECPNCTAWLVEHRFDRTVQCHHCGYSMPVPETCPECSAEATMVACGPGVERVYEEVVARFPDVRCAIAASDTLTSPSKAAALIEQIETGAVDLLIGTQIITKGYHFPRLTLVGVVDADLGLRGGDLRASERTYQQLAQVAGRAGRADRSGQVFLQTYDPDHPVTAALIAGDKWAFMEREEEQRRKAGLPPFGRLVGIVVSGPDLRQVENTGRQLARTAPRGDNIRVFGPAPAPIARLRGQHRHRLLLKTPRHTHVQPLIRRWLASTDLPRGVSVKVDVDPYSFF